MKAVLLTFFHPIERPHIIFLVFIFQMPQSAEHVLAACTILQLLTGSEMCRGHAQK